MEILHFTFIASFFLLTAQVGGQAATSCTGNEIENMDVSNCACASNFPQPADDLTCLTSPQSCSVNCNPSPPGPATSRSKLTTCGSGCVDSNTDCNGCYIWFHSLCSCIHEINNKSPSTTCRSSDNLTPGQSSPPVWMVLSQGDLMTTTELIPGILELQNANDPDGGFRLGQDTLRNGHPKQTYSRGTGTLSMNSVVTRSEEQVHIHLCDKPSSKIRDILDTKSPGAYGRLASVDLSSLGTADTAMSCRVSPTKGADVNVARDIMQYQASIQQGSCDLDFMGAAVITDSNDYSWSCITTGRRATERLFCYDP